MEGDTGHRSALDADASSLTNELKLVNIDTSGEEASSPTCPLNLLVRSPLSGKADLELSDTFMIGTNSTAVGGGGGGDRPVPTDELVDFREKGSREADGSGRGEDCDLVLIGDDALEQLTDEADMDNIFQEALALADQFSQLDKLDDADVSLVDSAPQSLPGESELLSLDSAMLAALAEARRHQPPSSAAPLPDSPLDSSYPTPTIPSAVSSLRSASAAAVAQAAAASAGGLTPPGSASRSSEVPGGQSKAPAPAPAPVVASQPSPALRPAASATQPPQTDPEPAVAADAPATPAAPAAGPAAAAPSRLAGRQRDSLAVAAGRRLVAPAAPAAAPAAPAPPPPPAADDAGYADLCQQASAEQRELERQADEEYENRQFEHLERRVSREDILDTDPEPGQDTDPDTELDSTDGKRSSRSQLSRKETYICRPNTGTFRVDKRQRFGTYKVDKTGTFKVPRASASAARSLPPEPAPEPTSDAPSSAAGELDGEQETAEVPTDNPVSDVNGAVDLPSDGVNNTFCPYGDDYGERSPSPPPEPLSASTPERGDPAGPAAVGRRVAGLRRPVTSTPCRSVGSSGSSIGLTPIRRPGEVEESPVPAPAAALRGPGLRQPAGSAIRQPAAAAAAAPAPAGLRRPAGSGLRQPATSGLKQPATIGLRQPAASGLKQPAASGVRQSAASGLRQPAASGLRQPAASGLRQPAASSGLRPPSASGLRAPSAAGAPRSAPARQTATQLRQSSAQSGSDSSVCSVRSLPGPNTSRSNPSLVSDRCDTDPAPTQRQPRQLPGPASRQPARGGGVRRSAGTTGSLTNISLQASHSAAASGLRRPTAGRNRHQETSRLSLSQQPAGSERF